jgi:hypothetical protein
MKQFDKCGITHDVNIVTSDHTLKQSELDAIRDRCEKAMVSVLNGENEWHVRILYDDMKALLSEIDRLTAENERLRKDATCGCGICLAHNNMVCPKLKEGD